MSVYSQALKELDKLRKGFSGLFIRAVLKDGTVTRISGERLLDILIETMEGKRTPEIEQIIQIEKHSADNQLIDLIQSIASGSVPLGRLPDKPEETDKTKGSDDK